MGASVVLTVVVLYPLGAVAAEPEKLFYVGEAKLMPPTARPRAPK